MPSISPRKLMSISTRSGVRRWALAIASLPLPRLALALAGKGMLERIRHQLVDDQRAGHREIDPEDDPFELHHRPDSAARVVGAKQLGRRRPYVLGKIPPCQILLAVVHVVG